MSTTRYGAGASRSAVAPRNESAASSSPESSSGVTPSASCAAVKNSSRLLASRAALVAVARTWVTPCSVERVAVLAQHGRRALDGLGRERAGAVDALTEAGDAHAPVERDDLGVAWRRAVDLGDEQAHRVGADVDRGDPRHGATATRWVAGPAADGVVAAGEQVRVVGVEALHALAGAAHPARRPGPGVAGHRSGRHARRRTRRGPPGARPGRPRPAASRTPPAASSRETCRFSSGSTSQYRVGIGVPSRVNGALRTTTGAPVGVAHHDLEVGLRLPPQPRGERGDVVGGGHARSLRNGSTAPAGSCQRRAPVARSSWWARAGSRTALARVARARTSRVRAARSRSRC